MAKNQLKNFAVFSGIAIQMGVTIYLGSLLGEWLDVKYHKVTPFYAKWITLLAVFLSVTGVIVQVTKFSKK